MATHQLHSLRRMDRCVLLEQGAVVASGTPSQVAECDHEFGELLRAELLGPASSSSPSATAATSRYNPQRDQDPEGEQRGEGGDKDSEGSSGSGTGAFPYNP